MTLVLDASAFAEIVLGGATSSALVAHAEADRDWAVPEHFTVEVASALRGAWLGGLLSDAAFPVAVQRLADAGLVTWPVRPLLPRIVELAPNVSAYDAAYLVLAERLYVPLLSADRRLRKVPGAHCRFLG